MSQQKRATVAMLIAVALMEPLSACKREPPPPAPAPTSIAPPVVTTPTAEPSGGPLLSVKGLDLCGKTNLEPLADLKVRVKRTDPDTGGSGDAEVACSFSMTTASGRKALMSLAVTTLKSVEEARETLRMLRKFRVEQSGMHYEGSLIGVGEEADGFSLETDKKEYQQAQYLTAARFENRVVEAWLGVFGKPFVPKAALSDKTRALLQATAQLASNYKRGEERAAPR